MASIIKEFFVDVSVENAWSAIRDVGAVHKRLAVGFVTDAYMDGDARVVTFANGMTVREQIVDINDANRRLVYAATGGRASHHNASVQVSPEGKGRSKIVWITDLLPNEMAVPIEGMMDQAIIAMTQTLRQQ